MFARLAQPLLTDLLAQFPAVVLLGPRQAGKTTLAFEAKSQHPNAYYLDLELPSAQRQLDDPEAFLQAHRHQLVVLDEVQRQPELFAVLRSVIDQRRRDGETAGQYLLLGSASGVLLQQTSESLAGRVAQLELPPLQLREVFAATAPPHGHERPVGTRRVSTVVSGRRRRIQPALARHVHRHLPRQRHSCAGATHSQHHAAPSVDHAGPQPG